MTVFELDVPGHRMAGRFAVQLRVALDVYYLVDAAGLCLHSQLPARAEAISRRAVALEDGRGAGSVRIREEAQSASIRIRKLDPREAERLAGATVRDGERRTVDPQASGNFRLTTDCNDQE